MPWPGCALSNCLLIRALCSGLRIPPLSSYGMSTADVAGLCANAANASSMKANPIQLTPAELREIVERAL